MCAYTYENGFLLWKDKVSNSFLLFVNDYKLTDKKQSELDECVEEGSVNREITNAYMEQGGVLNFSQQYTCFWSDPMMEWMFMKKKSAVMM